MSFLRLLGPTCLLATPAVLGILGQRATIEHLRLQTWCFNRLIFLHLSSIYTGFNIFDFEWFLSTGFNIYIYIQYIYMYPLNFMGILSCMARPLAG